jgi:hypothetical protein
MLYLITNNKTYEKQILVYNVATIPIIGPCRLGLHEIVPGLYIGNTLFAKIITPTVNATNDDFNKLLNFYSGQSNSIFNKFSTKDDFLAYLIYKKLIPMQEFQVQDILQSNKLKFIIAIVKYSNNIKELIYATNYIDIQNGAKNIFSLIHDHPTHNYEVYNYKIDTFLPYKTKQAALNLLEQLKNEFIEENTHGVITT